MKIKGNKLYFKCPCGCGDDHILELGDGGFYKRVGNSTVRPSINLTKESPRPGQGRGTHWHGFLTNGVFEAT